MGFSHTNAPDAFSYLLSYDDFSALGPLERANCGCLLMGFPSTSSAVTVAWCKDCFRCSPPARQAGDSCSCACVLRECSLATAYSMQPFLFLLGRLREWSSLPEHSSLGRLLQSVAACPLCCRPLCCYAPTTQILCISR